MANRGFTLVELLVGAVIVTVVLNGSAKFIEMSLRSNNAAKAGLVENDFKQTIAKGLENEGCNSVPGDASLKPANLEGSDKANGIGAFKSTFSLNSIKVGDFKDSIKVVKMELRNTDPVESNKRNFVVYYKHINLGSLSAPDPDNCKYDNDPTKIKATGCFEHTCTVNYKNTATDKHCTGSVNCHAFGVGVGGNPDCYKVDDSGKTLVGCDDTKDAGGTNTTAIGYGAGKDLTGGSNNIAIGHSVQLDSPAGSNQINIGNIIKAEQKDTSDTPVKKMGVLEVCNAQGDECIELSKDSLKCPPDHFFRGFYKETQTDPGGVPIPGKEKGKPICQRQSFCPQGQHFWPGNLCWHCPRDSPKYDPDAPEGLRCRRCQPGYDYRLTGLHKKKCLPPCRYSYTYSGDIPKHCDCPKGQTWSGRDPTAIPGYWVCKPKCLSKPGSFFNEENNKCVCPPALPHEYSDRCNHCPQEAPFHYKDECHKCHESEPYKYDNKCNPCPEETPYPYYSGGGRRNKRCSKCPYATPHLHRDDTCNRCGEGYHYSNGACCLEGHTHYTVANDPLFSGICCPDGWHYDSRWGRRAGCCPTGQNYDNGICCPIGYHNDNRVCLHNELKLSCKTGFFYRPNGYFSNSPGCCTTQNGGSCCPIGYHNDNGICCLNGRHNDNGICCLEGYHNDNRMCCLSGNHNSKGKCCPDGWHNSKGKCCPDGWHNSKGECCKDGYHNSKGKCCPIGKTSWPTPGGGKTCVVIEVVNP